VSITKKETDDKSRTDKKAQGNRFDKSHTSENTIKEGRFKT